MKNKHLVLAFLVAIGGVYAWNQLKGDLFSAAPDQKLAAAFLESYPRASEIVFNDGTEPEIRLVHSENGWVLNFGTLNAPADQDTIDAFLQDLKKLRVCPIPHSAVKLHGTFSGSDMAYTIQVHAKDTLLLFQKPGGSKAGLVGEVSHWFAKPYEEWMFRKLQTRTMPEIHQLVYEWRDFRATTLERRDDRWIRIDSSAAHLPQDWMRDSLLPALTRLNQLDPALQFDPVTESLKPFCSLHINDGKGGTLHCYRRTEAIAEYFLQSSHLPQICFKLPTETANTIFVQPMLQR